MANENGEWIMHGLDWDNPYRIRTWRELINWINEIGFLPLFKNDCTGFSAEEHVSPLYWWTGDIENDPWEWREIIAWSGEVAYGKFFGKKAGFISKEWFPVFANYRRDGYDFDARWDDELANIRHKKIMDCFEDAAAGEDKEHTGLQLKRMAGFGKDGYKNLKKRVMRRSCLHDAAYYERKHGADRRRGRYYNRASDADLSCGKRFSM